MIPPTRFEPGDHVAVRNVFMGRVQSVFPTIVVTDTPELVVTWLPVGTPVLNGVTDPEAENDDGKGHLSAETMAAKSWTMASRNWHTAGTLTVKAPHSMWSLWVFWEPRMSSIQGWYINIDAPYKRTLLGFDTWDMFLDVVVQPDRKTWQYKDEDEFAEAIEAGIFSEFEAEKVRDTAAQALKIVVENRHPFSDVWANWRPDVLWDIPQIPRNWEVI
ncbi:MAG: DUF402 domain-containing protein [Chloroflexi bacterium]|nr:DUF402 domain-containing protein [Chloroflexota bacterium]